MRLSKIVYLRNGFLGKEKRLPLNCDSLLKIQYYASYSANFAAAFGQPLAAASSK